MRRVEKGLSLLIGAVLAASLSTALLRDDNGGGTALPPTPTPTFSQSPFPSDTAFPTETATPTPSETPSETPTEEPTPTGDPTPTPTQTASEVPGPTPSETETPTEPTALPTTPRPTSTVKADLPKTGVGSFPVGWLLLAFGAAAFFALRSRPRPA